MTSLLVAAALSFAIALFVTPILRRLTSTAGLLDVPNERSSHAVPTPRGGGIAILTALTIACAVFHGFADRGIAVIVALALFVAAFSFIDDVRHVRPVVRLVLQAFGAIAAVTLCNLAFPLPFLAHPAGVAAAALAIVWIVGVINANNFMDGIDGIASIQTIITAATVCVLLLRAGDSAAAILAAALGGGAAGFLPWNFPKAKIFMGDVGSASIGFLLATLILRTASYSGIVAAALPMTPFLFDTSLTLVRRARRGERLWSAHREHLYQRLTQLTNSHAVATLVWGALAAGCAAAALAYNQADVREKVAIVVAVVGLHVAVAAFITLRERA